MDGTFKNVYNQHWLQLSKETRNHLRKVFDIPLTGITEIRDATLISDGTTNDDLQTITEAKMEKYVGSKESFSRLWELTLMKVKYELDPPILLPTLTQTTIDSQNSSTSYKNQNGENEKTNTEAKDPEGESYERPITRTAEVPTESLPSKGPSPKFVS